MRRVLLAQLSDLHLGVSLKGGKLALPPKKALERRAEQRRALERFAGAVRERRPDAVLMPGDLFDSGEPSVDDLNFLINTVNAMGPTAVFLAPGNHDGYAPSSAFNPHSALYQSRGGGPKWAGHVHIFTGEAFQAVPVPHHGEVTVTGAAYHRHFPESRRALAELAPAPEAGVHILLFHGSLLDYPRPGAEPQVLPFTTEELERAGYAYAAVGHYHHGGPIVGSQGSVLGAYAGAPFAASLADEGVGTWLEVELVPGQPLAQEALAWHRCDERSVRRVEMDVSGLTDTSALRARLEEGLAAAEASPQDLVHVTLRGRLARGIAFQPAAELGGRFFHAAVDDSGVEPDYDVDFDGPLPEEPGLAATSEEVLRWKMLELYRQATSDEERARIKEALFYGLDALTLNEIHLR
jgi:DNA repair exonuclease SbcCD nuclease subunit